MFTACVTAERGLARTPPNSCGHAIAKTAYFAGLFATCGDYVRTGANSSSAVTFTASSLAPSKSRENVGHRRVATRLTFITMVGGISPKPSYRAPNPTDG
ncbi:hypothetical protein DF3PB_10033 [uncultured Defluviicoccus sp.]|uniref:Uncharacterized protein n=1 Tax=metagenome TaxID=256318 RepID=A0A380T8H1_9ZZZZ|nr:hypothetical protein DF3PB_10033 [uncultured Defluviicoccus sp.]